MHKIVHLFFIQSFKQIKKEERIKEKNALSLRAREQKAKSTRQAMKMQYGFMFGSAVGRWSDLDLLVALSVADRLEDNNLTDLICFI